MARAAAAYTCFSIRPDRQMLLLRKTSHVADEVERERAWPRRQLQQCRGEGEGVVWANVTLEAEVGGVKEDTVMEEARAAHGKLVKRRPLVRWQRWVDGEEVGKSDGDGEAALVGVAGRADEGGEVGADGGEEDLIGIDI